ncbi:MAG: endonuclease III [Candidatus Lokiarchaeota archaeon]|nr:endonuclease III [Candidatus Lokiarchaeota archaeon]
MESGPLKDERKRAKEIIEILQGAYPDAPETYLKWSNPFELTIATILSANTTDASVNNVTPELFEKYPDAESMREANIDELKDIIRSVGLYNRKSDYIRESAKTIVEDFDGEVPSNMKDLTKLKGVSRKTANVILSTAFDKNEGVVVDTHVMRVTKRLELTNEKKRGKIEKSLMNLLPQSMWDEYARVIGAHGRQICESRNPKCSECPINHLCPYPDKDED